MIERRRLFFRSDFLSDIIQPCPFRRLVFSLHGYYQKNNGITYAKSFDSGHDSAVAGWLSLGCRFPVGAKERGKQPAAATKPDNTQTGLIELRYLDLVFFATFAF
jgi:hypothetical protein